MATDGLRELKPVSLLQVVNKSLIIDENLFQAVLLIILSLQYRNLIIFFCYLEKYTKL